MGGLDQALRRHLGADLAAVKLWVVVAPTVVVLLGDLSGLQNGGGLVPGAEHLIPAKQQ